MTKTMVHVTKSALPSLTFCGRIDNPDRCPIDTTLGELLEFMVGGYVCPGCLFSIKFRNADTCGELFRAAKVAAGREV